MDFQLLLLALHRGHLLIDLDLQFENHVSESWTSLSWFPGPSHGQEVCSEGERVEPEQVDSKETGKDDEGSGQANWTNFEATTVLNPAEAKEFLADNPDVEVLPTRWVDSPKSQPWEEGRRKARLVAQGDLESDETIRADSPTLLAEGWCGRCGGGILADSEETCVRRTGCTSWLLEEAA